MSVSTAIEHRTLSLHYMSGAGNLFTVIDNRDRILDVSLASRLAPQLCDARATLGKHTEGLMLIQLPESDDRHNNFIVEFFNPDGSSSMMCGNGSRCAVRFAQHLNIIPSDGSNVRFRMAGADYSAISGKEDIAVTFPPPLEVREIEDLVIDDVHLQLLYLNVGSDHAVIEEKTVREHYAQAGKEYRFESFAPSLRKHSLFPRGANANLYTLLDGRVELKTFERGVEAVTGACGTGAIATALTVWQEHHFPPDDILLLPPSGEAIHVSIKLEADKKTIAAIILRGGAEFIGRSSFTLSDV